MNKLIIMMMSLTSIQAMAGYQLAFNGKTVTCRGEDNQSFILNAKRTTLKYVAEGESSGPLKIRTTKTDKITYISYASGEGTLTLSNNGDTFEFAGPGHTPDGTQAETVNCQ